jgi:CrcB protein
MNVMLAVAAGGAVGSLARYLIMSQVGAWWGVNFPWGTLAVNVVGGFVIGALVEIFALVWSPGPEMRAFLTVGVLGGFTTFSAFSLDVVTLMDRGEAMLAALYVAASVVLSVLALVAGLRLFRMIYA